MRDFCVQLEARTLFSGSIAQVTADYDALLVDAAGLKYDYTAVSLTYKADSKIIAGDLKVLGKNKTNSADLAKLNKADAAAYALDTKVTSKLISVGKSALNRAKSAFLADVSHPTLANGVKLSKALTTLSVALAPEELTLATDAAAGDAHVDAALQVLVSANPTDDTLAIDVSAAENSSNSALVTLSDDVATTNTDISTLVADIS